ncbi:cell division protein FtsQ/DivIB [Alloscardovia omnicolens]|uniref:cell division protein FtsQ/DivIB n=1 Tax=Alloscardovia omnicolens TaxID=419015 RepID=UPI003A6186C4
MAARKASSRLTSSHSLENEQRKPRIIRASSLSSASLDDAEQSYQQNIGIDMRDELRARPKTLDFEERKKEQRTARRRYWFIRISIAVLSVAIITFGVWALVFSPWLKIHADKIYISGVQKWVSVAKVQTYTNPVINKSLVIVSESDIEQKLASIPGIASADVTKDYPHGLIVSLKEDTPTALLFAEDKGNYVPVDDQARHMDAVKQAEAGIPVINVPTAKSGLRNETVRESIAVLAGLDKDMRSHITSTQAKTQDSITTVLDSGYTVIWGNSSSIETKQKIVSAIINQLQAEGTATGTIDVSAPSRPIVK